MKKNIFIILVVFAALIGATFTQGATTLPTDQKDSISYNDQELVFNKTYNCQIMTIEITGTRSRLDVPDSTHMKVTLVYFQPNLNPHVQITVLPTSCTPGGSPDVNCGVNCDGGGPDYCSPPLNGAVRIIGGVRRQCLFAHSGYGGSHSDRYGWIDGCGWLYQSCWNYVRGV
jgi:hypothetical protein